MDLNRAASEKSSHFTHCLPGGLLFMQRVRGEAEISVSRDREGIYVVRLLTPKVTLLLT